MGFLYRACFPDEGKDIAMTLSENPKSKNIMNVGRQQHKRITFFFKWRTQTCDICEVQIKSILLVPSFVLGYLRGSQIKKSEFNLNRDQFDKVSKNVNEKQALANFHPHHSSSDLLHLFLLGGQSEDAHQDKYSQGPQECHYPVDSRESTTHSSTCIND